jgi:hypothetical protein
MKIMMSVRALLFALVVMATCGASFGQVRVAITIAPPALPVYEQPICPGDGYLWTPGYWAYDYDVSDYYWVPGTWVLAPEVGFWWTPAYWGWGDGAFVFYDGYWGPQIGFYGGINYGFGYFGHGYDGGRWDNGHFFYNRAVSNVNITVIHNVYETRVTNINENHVSFNGGNGGVDARATAEEEAAGRGRHVGPVAAQVQHAQAARGNPELRASANHGKPPIAATARPGEFSGSSVVAAKEAGGAYSPAMNRPATARPAAVHPKDLPAIEHPAAPNTGNANLDKKYQQQQDKLVAKQNQDRQKLQQQQDKEHQQLAKQNADNARQQQVEQKHQQQTEQLQQKHVQQTQQMQQRQAPRPAAGGGHRPGGD